ncbi:uncharacterized protein LOC144445068 isoform X2 [Glandiceps talaboti]
MRVFVPIRVIALVSFMLYTTVHLCAGGRILNAEVRVGDSANIGENTRCGELVGADRVHDETLTFDCDGLVSGRYVSVQLVGRADYLHVCEVQVMVPGQCGINIATSGIASQSSNYGNVHADRAIDGNTQSTWSANTCSHTNSDQGAWWKVDLGKSYDVFGVIVTNRQDCCSERILNAEVRVGDSANIGENTRCGELVGADRMNDETLTFDCDGLVSGRYVSVQLVDRADYLHVCEVQALVPPQRANGINVATTGTASQSSNYGSVQGHADRAIDGNTQSTWSANTCSHTNSDQGAWWKVDLGRSYDVLEVIVTNRQDCCSGRILNAEVRVGDSANIGENTRCGELVGADRVHDETLTFQCDGLVSGRYVSVQLVDRADYLHVCEVQVMAVQ